MAIPESAKKAHLKIIRIRKADSAWVYHVLEAQEGIVAYSSLPDRSPTSDGQSPPLSPEGLATSVLELTIPDGFLEEMRLVLEDLQRSGVWLEEVKS